MMLRWIKYLLGMNTTVTQSRTVVPLPATIVGALKDASGNFIMDEAGNPVVLGAQNQILDAIYALAAKVDKMSGTLTADLASLQADSAAQVASLATANSTLSQIAALISGLIAAGGATVDQLTEIHTVASSMHANTGAIQQFVATAEELATSGTNGTAGTSGTSGTTVPPSA